MQGKGFNGEILAARGGHIIYHEFKGYRNIQAKESLCKGSVFQLASVSKQFTGVAVLMLSEQGKLRLMDEVSEYIEGFPYKGVTIHHLLSHQSGLPEYMHFTPRYFTQKNVLMSNDEMLDILIKRKPARQFAPGARYKYCNTNYALLATLVEIASGQDFRSFVYQNIFEPLEMTNTFFKGDVELEEDTLMTTGFHSRNWAAQFNFQDGVYGDKGIYSTTEDLLKWTNAVFSGKLIGPKSMELAFATQSVVAKNATRGYGYGFRLDFSDPFNRIVYHTGLWGGYKTILLHRPCDNTTVVMLNNLKTSDLSLAWRIIGSLGEDGSDYEEEGEE